MKIYIPTTFTASVLILALGIFSGCGGGTGSSEKTSGFGIGGTGVTAAGQITGFGSIFVNGIRFDTSSADVTIDGNSAADTDLRLGMIVRIDGTIDGTGEGGTARTVTFDDEIQGPIAVITTDLDGLSKTLTVLGKTVIADSTSTVFDGITFATIAVNDVIEVSGFLNANGDILATRIEKNEDFSPGFSEVELKGIVSGLTGAQFSLGSFTVNFSGADLSDLPGSIVSNGLQVEVRGTLNGTTITASRVEEEDDLFSDSVTKVSLEGVITNYINTGNFDVAGQNINASSAQRDPLNLVLTDDMKVEVEGSITNGILVATKVEARDGDVKLEAKVTLVNTVSGTITLRFIPGSVEVQTDTQTKLQDDNGSITLNGINAGTDFVEVDAYIDDNGNIIANDISVQDESDDDIIEGPVDGSVSGSSITVLGLTFNTNTSTTDFELENDIDTTSSNFYSILNDGDIVKIKDDINSRDGIADEVEFKY